MLRDLTIRFRLGLTLGLLCLALAATGEAPVLSWGWSGVLPACFISIQVPDFRSFGGFGLAPALR